MKFWGKHTFPYIFNLTATDCSHSDPEKRKQYDVQGQQGFWGGNTGSKGGGGQTFHSSGTFTGPGGQTRTYEFHSTNTNFDFGQAESVFRGKM